MPDLMWIALPFVAALGSGVLSFIVAQARMETTLAREREELVGVQERLAQQQKGVEERVRAAEADARRKAFDEFLADVRIEERHYLRETDSPSEKKKCLVLQERVCFRNIPLSQWIERELPFQKEIVPPERPKAIPSPVPITTPEPGRRRLLR
ncbi:MAG: hypothetical protein IT159_03550 [Bryobacterales bacterium]|nr:hypothetical protein [Bryobacterales bacterium]